MSRARPTIAAPLAISPAELCRENGWEPGDVIERRGRAGPNAHAGNPYQRVRIRITAIGEESILGRLVNSPARPDGLEHQWEIADGREWVRVLKWSP